MPLIAIQPQTKEAICMQISSTKKTVARPSVMLEPEFKTTVKIETASQSALETIP